MHEKVPSILLNLLGNASVVEHFLVDPLLRPVGARNGVVMCLTRCQEDLLHGVLLMESDLPVELDGANVYHIAEGI